MAAFDPYRTWLGIPATEQPPHLYRLLGIGPFESDPDVISNAADRQMAHVRSYQSGKYSALSQQVLNELANARLCLLDPVRRRAYDEHLSKECGFAIPPPPPPPGTVATASAPPPPPPVPPPPLPPGMAPPISDSVDVAWVGAVAIGSLTGGVGRRAKSSWRSPAVVAAGVMAVLAGAAALIAYFASNSQTDRLEVRNPGSSVSPASAGKRTDPTPGGRRASGTLPGDSGGPGEFPPFPPPGSLVPSPVGPEKPARPPDSEPAAKPQEAKRLAEPDTASQQEAEKKITKDVFKKDFDASDRPAAKTALARKLLDEGNNKQPSAATTFVLLRLARDLAVDSGETDLALTAADELGKRFDVDVLDMKAAALQTMATPTLVTPRRKALVDKMVAVGEEALTAADYKTAERLFDFARTQAATKLRDPNLAKQAAARLKEAEQRYQQQEAFHEAVAALAAKPDDPQANLVVGKYYCFVKGDWAKGLTNLKACDDPLLKKLAETDLAGPQSAADRVALADGWWEAAGKEAGDAQQQVKRHAASLYKQAAGELVGVDKTKVEQRLAELDGSAGAAATELPVAPPPSVTGLECRDGAAKAAFLKAYGGNEASETAVERALDWLENHQKLDGSWSFDHTVAACKTQCPDPGTLDQAPNAATALALLPLLAAGNGAAKSKYHKNVVNGVTFLKNRMARAGAAGTWYERSAPQMPSHALATIAVCEACEGARDGRTRGTAMAAVYFIIQSQNSDGGWGLKPRLPDVVADGSDVQTTGWNVMALKSAQWAGLQVVPREAIDKTLKQADVYLERMASTDKLGFQRNADATGVDPYATASGMLCRMYLGWPRGQRELTDYATRLSKTPPSAASLYLDLFNSQMMRDFGGPTWASYNTALRDRLLDIQKTEGHAAGSWYINSGDWGNKLGGRLFCTAMAALVLEVYYRYPSVYK